MQLECPAASRDRFDQSDASAVNETTGGRSCPVASSVCPKRDRLSSDDPKCPESGNTGAEVCVNSAHRPTLQCSSWWPWTTWRRPGVGGRPHLHSTGADHRANFIHSSATSATKLPTENARVVRCSRNKPLTKAANSNGPLRAKNSSCVTHRVCVCNTHTKPFNDIPPGPIGKKINKEIFFDDVTSANCLFVFGRFR